MIDCPLSQIAGFTVLYIHLAALFKSKLLLAHLQPHHFFLLKTRDTSSQFLTLSKTAKHLDFTSFFGFSRLKNIRHITRLSS